MANKLLLIEDVEALGRSGDVVSVRAGYARNYLIPQGFAVVADRNTLRKQKQLQEVRRLQAVEDKKASEELAGQVKDLTITTRVKLDHAGHMYGSVSTLDIVNLLQEKANVTLPRKMIQLAHPIKEIGVFTINLKLNEGITSSFILKVLAEGAVEEEVVQEEQTEKAE